MCTSYELRAAGYQRLAGDSKSHVAREARESDLKNLLPWRSFGLVLLNVDGTKLVSVWFTIIFSGEFIKLFLWNYAEGHRATLARPLPMLCLAQGSAPRDPKAKASPI